jgi:hypothetical protein
LIKALFKFSKDIPDGSIVIDTTSGKGEYRELSPFVLPAPPAKCFENLWQYSKVYNSQIDSKGEPVPSWYGWRERGFTSVQAHRYPMGKGMIPEYSYWDGQHLGYIQARKQIYIPEYSKNVSKTESYHKLDYLYQECLGLNRHLILLDYDAYDHQGFGMTLKDVVHNPNRKMGHAFVLLIMLTNQLKECLTEW